MCECARALDTSRRRGTRPVKNVFFGGLGCVAFVCGSVWCVTVVWWCKTEGLTRRPHTMHFAAFLLFFLPQIPHSQMSPTLCVMVTRLLNHQATLTGMTEPHRAASRARKTLVVPLVELACAPALVWGRMCFDWLWTAVSYSRWWVAAVSVTLDRDLCVCHAPRRFCFGGGRSFGVGVGGARVCVATEA